MDFKNQTAVASVRGYKENQVDVLVLKSKLKLTY